jgi:hypothetical protein
MYNTQEAIITQKTRKDKIAMIVSQVANESIRNMNETKDLKICKTTKQHPNMLDMIKIYCKKQKQQK